MNHDKMDIHAYLLRNRAETLMHMDNLSEAEMELVQTLDIRKSTLKPPHVQITITYHTMGELMYRKGSYLYRSDKGNAFPNFLPVF